MCFTYNKINEHIYEINDGTNVRMFFIEGSDKCCLVDTSYGYGDLRSFINTITNKPVFCVLTHGHADHAGGASLYEKTYMSSKDNEVYNRHMKPEFRIASLQKYVKDIDDKLLQPKRDIPFLPLNDGDNFDLGEITIKIIECAGHTDGSVMVLIPEEKTIIFGDAVARKTLFVNDDGIGIKDYLKNLLNVKEYSSEYDVMLRNHDSLYCPADLLDNVIDCCNQIINGTDDKQVVSFGGKTYYFAKTVDNYQQRVDGKEGNIVYNPDLIK